MEPRIAHGPDDVSVGDVIQIDPDHDDDWGGCLLAVSDIWLCGVGGFIEQPHGGETFYRIDYGEFAVIGKAAWVRSDWTRSDADETQNGDTFKLAKS